MKFINILVVVALMTGGLHLHAQTAHVEYTTELQTNFRESNFVNLLHLNADMPIGKSLLLEAATISIAKTRNERLLDDLQTFSNIEEDNLPLAIAVFGANWQINNKHTLFMGIRNMNEDYFCSDVTSFFTNSSCGIYPTISANYPIANYPVASMGVHYCYDESPIRVQASLYNGTGYNRLTGRENVFRVCPKDDGVFGVAEVSYTRRGSSYFLGNALYYKEGISTTPWFYTEQRITSNLTLLAGYSHAFAAEAECKDFVGFGAHYQQKKFEVGLFADYASFVNAKEFATEITFKYNATKHLYVQPIFHLISSSIEESACNVSVHTIGSLRIGVSF